MIAGRQLRIETDVEIIAKKMWHRGDSPKARDLFDLAVVIHRSPDALRTAGKYLARNADTFLCEIEERQGILKEQYEAIDALGEPIPFEHACEIARQFLSKHLAPPQRGSAKPS